MTFEDFSGPFEDFEDIEDFMMTFWGPFDDSKYFEELLRTIKLQKSPNS